MSQFKTQLDKLAQFRTNNKMTRAMEQTYLEKCRDFVEMMIASESLVTMSEIDNYMDETNVNEIIYNNNEMYNNIIIESQQYQQECVRYQQECQQYYQRYQQECQQYYTELFNKYKSDMEEYRKWYEKELNEYYMDYTQTILWDYYENTTKNLEKMNQSLIYENYNLSELVRSIEGIETNYNNVKKEYKHLSSEYTEINRRLLIMIREYNKLYNQHQKLITANDETLITATDETIITATDEKVTIEDTDEKVTIEDTEEFIHIGSNYAYD